MANAALADNGSDTLFLVIDAINSEISGRKVYAIVSKAGFSLVNADFIQVTGFSTGTDNRCQCWSNRVGKPVRTGCIRLKLNAIIFSTLLYELNRSRAFRINVIDNFIRKGHEVTFDCEETSVAIHLLIKVVVDWTVNASIDLSWNVKLDELFVENVELENTMAWLSTLGGAYSSLGDEFVDYAKIAGRISQHQYRLAARLGDVVVLSRCKLYFALSLLQLGYLQRAKCVIREQYEVARSLPSTKRDVRLENMCKGAWAKLKYAYVLRKKSRKQLNNNNINEILIES